MSPVLSCALFVPTIVLSLFLALLLLPARPAHAQSSERSAAAGLTARGRFMPGGAISAFWSNDEPTFFGNFGSYATWNLSVAPSLVYFIRDDVAVGIAGGGGYQRGKLSTAERYKSFDASVGAIALWNIRLGGRVSVMLQPFLGYAQSRQIAHVRLPWGYPDLSPSGAAPGGPSDTPQTRKLNSLLRYVRFALALPLVFAISDAVGIGVGPDLVYDLCFRAAHISSEPDTRSRRNRVRVGAFAGVYASF